MINEIILRSSHIKVKSLLYCNCFPKKTGLLALLNKELHRTTLVLILSAEAREGKQEKIFISLSTAEP